MNNISLIGFMGSGKTTIGKRISEIKNLAFYDIDAMIVDEAQKSIADIFDEFGEAHFRLLETNMIKSLKSVKNAVISCGGGAALFDENIRILREISTVVYLQASVDKILANLESLENEDTRPLLLGSEPKAKVERILKIRKPIYMKSCHISVDVTKFNVDEAALKLLGLLERL